MLFLDYRYLKNKLKIHKVITKINLFTEKKEVHHHIGIFFLIKRTPFYM